jgi:hypothetical protein
LQHQARICTDLLLGSPPPASPPPPSNHFLVLCCCCCCSSSFNHHSYKVYLSGFNKNYYSGTKSFVKIHREMKSAHNYHDSS